MKYNIAPNASDLSVLLVEDYQPFREDLFVMLELYFDEVLSASNGQEGLKKYKEYHKKNNKTIDILISDIQMPYLNGIDLVKAVRAIEPSQEIVIISAYSNSEFLIEFLNIGITQYIVKPLQSAQFFDTINLACSNVAKKNEVAVEDQKIALGEKRLWDSDKKILLKGSEIVTLPRHCNLLLELFVNNANEICSNEMIIEHFSMNSVVLDIKNIRHHVLKLRKYIPNTHLENIYAEGYRLQLEQRV